MNREGEDKVVWMDSSNRVYSINALYFVLKSSYAIPFPLGIIWNQWVSSKVSLFA